MNEFELINSIENQQVKEHENEQEVLEALEVLKALESIRAEKQKLKV